MLFDFVGRRHAVQWDHCAACATAACAKKPGRLRDRLFVLVGSAGSAAPPAARVRAMAAPEAAAAATPAPVAAAARTPAPVAAAARTPAPVLHVLDRARLVRGVPDGGAVDRRGR